MPIGRPVALLQSNTTMAGTTEQADRKKPEDTGEPNELIGKGHPNKTNKETQRVWVKSSSRQPLQ